MKTKLLVTLAAIGLALLIPSGASAACTGTQIDLSNNNIGGQGIDVCITITTSGGNTTITLVSVGNVPASFGSFQKVFDVGWNTTGTFISASPAVNWQASTPDQGFDGFNSFIINGAVNNGSPFAVLGQSWTVSGTGITIVAMHLGFTNGTNSCTFVASNGGTGSSTGGLTNTNCNGTVVPEPGTMALFGSGLVAIAGIIRRRFAA